MSNGKRINNKNVAAVRLVSKQWLQSASRILQKSGDSVIQLTFGHYDENVELNSKLHAKNIGNMLNDFTSVFSKGSRLSDSILPVYLDIYVQFFITKNSEVFVNLLDSCGDIISKLQVEFPASVDSLVLKCDDSNFPILKTIDVTWTSLDYEQFLQPQTHIFIGNENGWCFLQDILQKAKNVQSISLNISEDEQQDATKIGNLQLPDSIKTLKYNGFLGSKELQLFTNNKLPNLDALDLEFTDTFMEDQLTCKVLDQFRFKLKKFRLMIRQPKVRPYISNFIKFPQLEHLKSFTVITLQCKLCPQSLQKLIPNIERLLFIGLTESLFVDWIRDSIFQKVVRVEAQLESEGDYNDVSPTVRTLEEMCLSFPNSQKLGV